MRSILIRCIGLAFSLIWAAIAVAQPGAHFVVNGLDCTENVCSVNVSDFSLGAPLRLGLRGAVPVGQSLELYLEQESTKPVKGVMLEYGGYSVAPGTATIRVPSTQVRGLWRSTGSLLLHLGELSASSVGRIVIRARVPKSTQDYAVLVVDLAGLRTPGAEMAWDRSVLFAKNMPAMIPMYPNPVKSGMLHIDLQAMPFGRKGALSIIDILGSTVYSAPVQGGTLVECPSDGLSKGVYFVRVDLDGLPTRTGRLVVDR